MSQPLSYRLSIVAAALLLQASTGLAIAKDAPSLEKKKKNVVWETYQLVYEPQEICRSSAAGTQAVKEAEAEFKAEYPELMTQVDRSPHLAAARERSKKKLADMPDHGTAVSCEEYASFMRLLIVVPQGRSTVEKWVETLKR
jgi:hypothetical protein